jgi:hypothetical protein
LDKNCIRNEVVRGGGTLARIEGGFRSENAVMGNTEIIYSGPNGTQAARHHRTRQTKENPRSQPSRHQQGSVSWNENEHGAEEQSQYPASEGSDLSPIFYAVSRMLAASREFIHNLQIRNWPI